MLYNNTKRLLKESDVLRVKNFYITIFYQYFRPLLNCLDSDDPYLTSKFGLTKTRMINFINSPKQNKNSEKLENYRI